ncbi:uncharacterized protein LOC126843578 [Adelges cooleyi]|uniref:uncharacterized protein LOC126843578 n=1 Tax=Adelges cooleyi TaxID=133065 RepID=UPI00217F5C8E|nr:uncharacterized protein LOC126843578 [Adelges cooleyi]
MSSLKPYIVTALLVFAAVGATSDPVGSSSAYKVCSANDSPGICLIKGLLKNAIVYFTQPDKVDDGADAAERVSDDNALKESKGIEDYVVSQLQNIFGLFSFGLELPEVPWALLKSSFFNARGKKNKNLGPMLAAGAAVMGGTLLPLALGALFLLAGKAIMTSMLAITISGLIGLKSLFSKHETGHVKAYTSVPTAGHYSEQYEQEMGLYKGQTEAKMHAGFYAGESTGQQTVAGYYKGEQQSAGSNQQPDYYAPASTNTNPKYISSSGSSSSSVNANNNIGH